MTPWNKALLGMMCASLACVAASASAQVAPVSAGQAPNEGFIRVTQSAWTLSGTPPVVKFCVSSEEKPGLIANTVTCNQWGNAQAYLDRRFPGMGVKLTRLDYQCEALNRMGCENRIVLYYQVQN